jgi:thioredoxin-like negative regulator of GroEL
VKKNYWKWGLITLAAGAVLLLGWLGLRHYQTSKSVGRVKQAIEAGQYQAAVSALNYLRAMDSDHPDLNLLSAQIYSRIYPLYALPFWNLALRESPNDGNLRIGYILTLIKVQQMEQARQLLELWPADSNDGVEYHRAALALSFAVGNMLEAREHAVALNRLEPESAMNRINLLKLRALDSDSTVRIEAQDRLQEYLDNPEFRFTAIKLLLQSELLAENSAQLEALIEQLKSITTLTSEELLMLMDAGQRMGLATDPELVRRAWENAAEDLIAKSRVAGWMVQAGLNDLLLTWIEEQKMNPQQVWEYPMGLPVAEAYRNVGRPETALPGLRKFSWPGIQYLNQFTQAYLTADSQAGESMLQYALKEASTQQGSLVHLAETARKWRWQQGWITVLREQLKTMASHDPRFVKVMQIMEEFNDTQGLYIGSLRYLDQNAHHAPSLNNAAYLGFLLGEDAELSLTRARKAVALAPEVPEYRNTLAMALIRAGHLSEAAELKATSAQAPLDASAALVRALMSEAEQRPIDPQVRQILTGHEFRLPEEQRLKQRLLE